MDKTFNLDANILGPNSSTTISIGANSDADVLAAILQDDPFPNRPGGKIPLGSIALSAAGQPVNFKANGGLVNFGFEASFQAGARVFDKAADAIESLKVDAELRSSVGPSWPAK